VDEFEAAVRQTKKNEKKQKRYAVRHYFNDSGIHLPDCYDLAKRQGDTVHLSDEDSGYRLVESRAVHVDRGTNRKYKPRDTTIQAEILFETTECHRQSGSAAYNDDLLLTVCYT
jgi:hypothetical protein